MQKEEAGKEGAWRKVSHGQTSHLTSISPLKTCPPIPRGSLLALLPLFAAPTVHTLVHICIEQDKRPIFNQLESAASHVPLPRSLLIVLQASSCRRWGTCGASLTLWPRIQALSSPHRQTLSKNLNEEPHLPSDRSLICAFRHSSAFRLAWPTPQGG